MFRISKAAMDTSLERIRAKIIDLEAKIADLRIAEREIQALEELPARTCAGAKAKAKTQAGGKQPGGGAPDHRLRDSRRFRPAGRPLGRRDRRAYQGDRPRHQQSNRILFAAIVEKARPRKERGRQVGAPEGRLSASSLVMEILMAFGRPSSCQNPCASGRERVEGPRHGRACAPSRGILTGSSINLDPARQGTRDRKSV